MEKMFGCEQEVNLQLLYICADKFLFASSITVFFCTLLLRNENAEQVTCCIVITHIFLEKGATRVRLSA